LFHFLHVFVFWIDLILCNQSNFNEWFCGGIAKN